MIDLNPLLYSAAGSAGGTLLLLYMRKEGVSAVIGGAYFFAGLIISTLFGDAMSRYSGVDAETSKGAMGMFGVPIAENLHVLICSLDCAGIARALSERVTRWIKVDGGK